MSGGGPRAISNALKWTICIVAAMGCLFDIYVVLVGPLILQPALIELGGLRPGTTQVMHQAAKDSTRTHWEHVYEASGQPFDFGFFDRQDFVYDTDPAARATVMVRRERHGHPGTGRAA